MSRYSKKTQTSPETQEEALKVAKATQRPGQTKEQTKLIAQGIQKGIELYKKQQKERSRELNKKLKKVSGRLSQLNAPEIEEGGVEPEFIYRQHWLPWLLLGISWAGFVAFVLFGN
ncbi:DUF2956 domain-containing protein [methanotrophic endosymbiont of Bathymodiolus puteoserpentis (Logatchev)]|jgi:hypothetical protein|uniref:DUF2956 domain-containing protein n=1 Tax=methanotrophic endosymbiont of Bathymodiolus puteoserpentis (Logatchev) TaxID=343235 RepID=UPI00086B6405|nr:DUF2956 domain-containing protein [methanotrophic endosymbiont of Bathymodiolus puteoserpentis (Logatchev)]SCN46968.1 FIG00922492: hypothetical protein [methanotrophic endosymbiont of Bathymodiolus azoricus (Menez Gwen)]SHE23618.1 FIG00922492: hypothetical protein [methanotrophic endosymbiont of Bathymodiolus puteoserpentis (Logatchev)]